MSFKMTASTQGAVSAILVMIYYSIRLDTMGEVRLLQFRPLCLRRMRALLSDPQNSTPIASFLLRACNMDCMASKLWYIYKRGVEDRRLEAKAKGRLLEDRPSRVHGQEFSRPKLRTQSASAPQ